MNPTKPIPSSEVRPVLPRVKYPEDLRKLSLEELEQLCSELRHELWDTITAVGGHLAASLGVVELTVALHYVYDTPRDKLVWDVGHQGYIHKILTGRRELLPTIRQYGGLSGFLKRDESEYDTFGAGHASTSISAALGMAVARDLLGEDHSVVAVIGDGGMTGGLAFEALNNAGGSGRNMTVVLNDNGMSISRNVGAVSRFLLKMELNPRASKLKDEIWKLLGDAPVGARRLQHMAGKLEASLKSLLSPGMLFEDLGFQYFGPFDGHDLRHLIRVFTNVKTNHRHPTLVHVVTVKGKGYEVAETDPIKYHGVKGTVLPAKVEPPSLAEKPEPTPSFTNVFGEAILQEVRRNPLVVVVTAAMKEGTGLVNFSQAYPDRFFDVGIAEGHAITFSAGLAASGLRPVAAVYSTFLQRAYDQVLHDCALQHLPVVICVDRAGLVGEDGPTHHGGFDLSYLSPIPGMVVAAPRSGQELRNLLHTALEYSEGPFAIRYPRDRTPDVIDWTAEPVTLPIGSWEILREGRQILVLAVGTTVGAASRAITREELDVTLVNCRFVKPLDAALLKDLLKRHSAVVTLEENAGAGGFGAQVALFMKDCGFELPLHAVHLPDEFVEHGPRDLLLDLCGLSEKGIAATVRSLLPAKHTVVTDSAAIVEAQSPRAQTTVIIDPRAGFCGGVKRVVKMAEQHMAETGEPLVSLGDVIHNEVEIGRLRALGLSGTSHDVLEGNGNGARKLLIRAHGEPPETFEKARKLGIEILDGTCPVVTRSQDLARSHYLAGEQVVIVGKPYHPETIGIRGHCDHQATVVYERSDVERLDPARKTYVLAQTTVARHWFEERIAWIKERCKNVEVQIENTLCRFVVGRDRDLAKFAREVNVLIMVGGTQSSNTKVLYDVCRKTNPRSHLVVTGKDIQWDWFREGDIIGVTGSASTPHWLLEQVRNHVAGRLAATAVA